MSQKMKRTLQAILDSIDNPAFIKNNDKILMSNRLFNICGFTEQNFNQMMIDEDLKLKEKKLEDDLVLCELMDCDLYLLQISRTNITKAMALL